MPTWPTTKASTSNVDSGSDKPRLARADIKDNIDNTNKIIDMFNITTPSDQDTLVYSTANARFELAPIQQKAFGVFSDSFNSGDTFGLNDNSNSTDPYGLLTSGNPFTTTSTCFFELYFSKNTALGGGSIATGAILKDNGGTTIKSGNGPFGLVLALELVAGTYTMEITGAGGTGCSLEGYAILTKVST